MNVAINGFGRIGKLVFRSFLERKIKGIDIKVINELGSLKSSQHLLEFDSTHGRLPYKIKSNSQGLEYKNKKVIFTSQRNENNLPWKKYNIDIILDCSGAYTSREKAEKHLKAGAKKVIVSAPTANADITVVQGVNNKKLDKKHMIISNGSCTTNCLAPVAMILDQNLKIKSGFMTTIHSFTGDQRTVDQEHSDLRRARTASTSMIPTSTGAAKAIGLVLPNLLGKLDGTAIRVPTPNVSLIDFTFTSNKKTSVKEINDLMINASKNKNLKDILTTNNLPLVSVDFNHNTSSSIFDLTQTQVINNDFCRILSWYDNEWGFSNRMIDTMINLKKFIK